MSDFPKRTLVATKLTYIATLKNGSTLFDVEATNEDGTPVDETFRSFVELDLNKPVEYEVRPYNDRVRGTTFTLLPLERQSRTAILQDKVMALEERMNAMENEFESHVLAVVDERIDGALKDAAL